MTHPTALRRALTLLALAALTLLAAWPVLRAGYPTIGDGLNHYYRLVEFAHLLAHGDFFLRAAEGMRDVGKKVFQAATNTGRLSPSAHDQHRAFRAIDYLARYIAHDVSPERPAFRR